MMDSMRNRFKKPRLSALFALLFLMAAGCAQQPFPEADSDPARLFLGKCGLCHDPYHPQTHTRIGWGKVIPRMEKRAEEFGMSVFLTEDEKTTILTYLEKHARKGF